MPGNVDPAAGTTRYLPNFGWLEPVDLTARLLELPLPELADRTGTLGGALGLGREHVHLRNDGRCAALAERHFGVGAGGAHSVMAMLTLGTGIGGALVHDPSPTRRGELFDGCSSDAG